MTVTVRSISVKQDLGFCAPHLPLQSGAQESSARAISGQRARGCDAGKMPPSPQSPRCLAVTSWQVVTPTAWAPVLCQPATRCNHPAVPAAFASPPPVSLRGSCPPTCRGSCTPLRPPPRPLSGSAPCILPSLQSLLGV